MEVTETPDYEALSAAFETVDLEEADAATPEYEALSAGFEAVDLAAEDELWEVEEESGEVELGEAEAFLELAFEAETGAPVTFPSGATLRAVSGPTGQGEEHHDPNGTGNPLLDTSEPIRSTLLSANFSVRELTRSGGVSFDKARIDPELVRSLQKLRDHVGKAVNVTSGYRPFGYNETLYKSKGKKPTKSRHSSGQAVDVNVAGMTGMEIAKAAIDACGTNIGVGIANTFAHIDVRGEWGRWTYFGDATEKGRAAIAEIDAYRRQRLGAATPPARDGAPPAGASAQILEALGRGLWDTAARIAIGTGVTDVNKLTNMLFYLRHPELRGQKIQPEQRELVREWIEIRDRWVKPALSGMAAPTSAPDTVPAPTGGLSAAQFGKQTPESQRYAALIPLLDRYRGDIPLHFLLGWIDVESNGRIDVITKKLNERGFFQIHPDESKDNKIEHARLTTDPDYSVQAGIKLVRVYVELARKRYKWIAFGSELFWRIVKLQHAMGAGLTKMLLTDMTAHGIPPITWAAIKAYEVTPAAQRLHRLLRVDPIGRFGRNVDEVFERGRKIAAKHGR